MRKRGKRAERREGRGRKKKDEGRRNDRTSSTDGWKRTIEISLNVKI